MSINEAEERSEISRLILAGDQILRELQSTAGGCGLFPPPLTHRGRVKTEDAILGKLARKRQRNPAIQISDITDVVGYRFITLFRDDVVDVVRAIFTLLSNGAKPGRTNILANRKVFEYIQMYSSVTPTLVDNNGERMDVLTPRLRACAQTAFGGDPPLELRVEERDTYTGVHIVVKADHQIGHRTIQVPIEIQVRTVFEDAWGEVDHKLFYEVDRQGGNVGDQARTVYAPHLKLLKRQMDTASDYASQIKLMVSPATPSGETNILRSLDDIDYAIQFCRL